MKKSIEERFWARVRKTEKCWLWQGNPQLYVDDRLEWVWRYSYQLHIGKIPEDMKVHQKCQNRNCVNPDHLYLSYAKTSKEKQKYQYNLDVFYNEDAVSYYLLGSYMTDGCIWSDKANPKTKSVRLTSKDIDWLIDIKNLICKDIKIFSKSSKNNKTTCGEIWVNSSELAEWFIAKGCVPKKSLTMKFPKVPEKYLPDFLRGCIDGDGSLYLSKKNKKGVYSYNCSLCGGSEYFFKELEMILNNVGYKFSIKKKGLNPSHKMENGKIFTQKHPYYVATIYSSRAIDFIKWIYYEGNPISMSRKQKKANQIILTHKKYGSRKISIVDKERND